MKQDIHYGDTVNVTFDHLTGKLPCLVLDEPKVVSGLLVCKVVFLPYENFEIVWSGTEWVKKEEV